MGIKHYLPKDSSYFLAGLMVGIFGAYFVYFPLTDPDIFWHLASGRELIGQKHFFTIDPFSYTSVDARWIDLHWFFQVVVYTIQDVSGNSGLLIVKSVLFGIACTVSFSVIATKRVFWFRAILTCILLYELRYLVPMRPIVVTLLCIALFLFFLERYTKTGKKRYIALLVPLQVIWVNSQGLFILGPIITGLFLSGELLQGMIARKYNVINAQNVHHIRWHSSAIILALVTVSCIVNPYGIAGVLFPLQLFERIDPSLKNIYATAITENMPLFRMLGTSYSHYVFTVVVVASIGILAIVTAGKNIRLSYVLIGLAFFYLAYMAQRNIILFMFAAIPALNWHLSHSTIEFSKLPPRWKRTGIVVATSIAAIALMIPALVHAKAISEYPSSTDIAPFGHPVGSVEYLSRNPIEGNVFNADRHGGYILWKLFPSKKVFIDTRLILRSRRFFADYLAIVDNPSLYFPHICGAYNITHAIVPVSLVDRYLPLARYLYDDPEWQLAYTDGSEALFVLGSHAPTKPVQLDTPQMVQHVMTRIGKRWENDKALYSEAYLHLADFLFSLNLLSSAEMVIQELDSPLREYMQAQLLYRKGDYAGAIEILNKMIDKDPKNVNMRLLLAKIYRDNRRFQMALENVLYVLKREPFNGQARMLVSEIKETIQTH